MRSDGAGISLVTWAGAFIVTQVATAIVLVSTGYVDVDSNDMPTSVVAMLAVVMWLIQLFAVAWWANRVHRTSLVEATRLSFSASDLWGIPIGIVSQFVVVPLVTFPFTKLFPDAFSAEKVAERAEQLADMAAGAWIIALALVVVIGAPIIEEIVYRGMLQRGFVATWGPWVGVIATAAMFAAIHLSWPEIPGLFAFALVLGVIRHRTGRLGGAIITHMAFNACGLLLVTLL